VDTERQAGTGGSVPPLTRADVERLRSKVESAAQLDLSLQNLQHVDLSYLDLQGTNLRGADLQGADLSTAQLHGPELRGARLYRDELFSNRMKHARRGISTQKRLTPAEPLQGQAVKQSKKALSDREAYLLGEHALLAGADPVRIRQLFPQRFSFAMARRLFDAWLGHSGDTYSGQEIDAMWVGFAHHICDLYHGDESET
jgi:Pentapeptide repeats (8 copies)